MARLWIDQRLAPSEVLDCPPQVLAVVIADIHRRRAAAEAQNAARDAHAGGLMHQIVDNL